MPLAMLFQACSCHVPVLASHFLALMAEEPPQVSVAELLQKQAVPLQDVKEESKDSEDKRARKGAKSKSAEAASQADGDDDDEEVEEVTAKKAIKSTRAMEASGKAKAQETK